MRITLIFLGIISLLATGILGCEEEKENNCKGGWLDNETGFCWEDPPNSEPLPWSLAAAYCQDLELGGNSDWRLPHIDELRTLVRGCPASELGGACPITDGSLADDDTSDCDGCSNLDGPGKNGCFWHKDLNGDCNDWYWSYSWTDVYGWRIDFANASFGLGVVGNTRPVRCYRDTNQ